MASLFSESPDKADKALSRKIEKSLTGGDVAPALDALGEAPGLIFDRPLASQALDGLSKQLAIEQVRSPGDRAQALTAIIPKTNSLEKRLAYDLNQRLVRRLRRWQTGPGAARQLASDLHQAALADMVASVLIDQPNKVKVLLGDKRFEALGKELRKRKFIKGQEQPQSNLERWDWISIIDDASDLSSKDEVGESLYQGVRRFYELPVRDRIFSDFDIAAEDPEWQAI